MESVFILIKHPEGNSIKAEAKYNKDDFDAFVKFLDFTWDAGCTIEAIEECDDINETFTISKVK